MKLECIEDLSLLIKELRQDYNGFTQSQVAIVQSR